MMTSMKLLLAFLLYISVAVASDFFDDDCNYSKTAAVNIGGTAVTCGHEYPLKLVSAPDIKVTFDEADADKLYVITMVDPDAPSHFSPKCRSWLHYIRENVKGSDLRSGREGGDVVEDYNPPTPPLNSGYHRYFVYVFKQEKKLSLSSPSNRCGFNVAKFARENNLKAVATTMFKTKTI